MIAYHTLFFVRLIVVTDDIRYPQSLRNHEYKREGHKSEYLECTPGLLRVVVGYVNIQDSGNHKKSNPDKIQFRPLCGRNLFEVQALDQAEKSLCQGFVT